MQNLKAANQKSPDSEVHPTGSCYPLKESNFVITNPHFYLVQNSVFCFLLPAAAAAKSLQSVVSDSLRLHRRQPTRLPHPWDSPGKNTRVGCHFLLQCMKVKSESEVTQSCPTLSDPMDHSLPGSSIHGIFQARVLEWGAIAFSYSTLISFSSSEILSICQIGSYPI